MSEPIKVGDLVMVFKPNHCGCSRSVGLVFRVKYIDRSKRSNWCVHCGHNYAAEDQANDGEFGAQLWRLKRIPPLSELESEKREDELHA